MQEESIFIEALEKKDAAERAAFLDQACAGDDALGRGIERLLLRQEQTGCFFSVAIATPTGSFHHASAKMV
jgi:hypothetical protein